MAADFTIADVLAWARTKPAGKRYDFRDVDRCAAAQFGIETNRPELVGVPSTKLARICSGLELAAVGNGSPESWTFGAFAGRLEKLCPETAVTDWSRLSSYMVDIDGVKA
jgi:hypothetical protein